MLLMVKTDQTLPNVVFSKINVIYFGILRIFMVLINIYAIDFSKMSKIFYITFQL